jgi:hypothetical protein
VAYSRSPAASRASSLFRKDCCRTVRPFLIMKRMPKRSRSSTAIWLAGPTPMTWSTAKRRTAPEGPLVLLAAVEETSFAVHYPWRWRSQTSSFEAVFLAATEGEGRRREPRVSQTAD